MKNAKYELSEPIDGVKELVLHAPTRNQLKFAAFIKSSFMSIALDMADKVDTTKSKPSQSEDTVLVGSDMLAALYVGDCDMGEMLDRFLCACTDSPMCQMNGGPVPKAFFEDFPVKDTEGLFADFLGIFITI